MGQCHYLLHCMSHFFESKNTFAKPKLSNSAFYGRKSGALLVYHAKDPKNKVQPTLNFVVFPG